MLVFLDARDVDQEGNRGDVIELQRGVRRVIGPPSVRLVRLQLRFEVEVGPKRKRCLPRTLEIERSVGAGRAHCPGFAGAYLLRKPLTAAQYTSLSGHLDQSARDPC